eukprot:4296047-Prymnesium_polylepis.1
MVVAWAMLDLRRGAPMPVRPACSQFSQPTASPQIVCKMADEDRTERIANLDATLTELEAAGYPQETIALLKAQLNELKVQDVMAQL